MGFEWVSWSGLTLGVGIAVAIEFGLFLALKVTGALLRRRYPQLVKDYSGAGRQFLMVAALSLLRGVVAGTWPHEGSKAILEEILLLAIIASIAWLIAVLASLTINRIRDRHPIDGDDDQVTRRLQTQLSLIRGFVVAAIWLVAAGLGFSTIPGAERVGTSILASAGIASVIAGIAAQSLLGNVFAGLQLAFNGSVRVNDLVVANGQSGRVEEVTLATVIMRLWDGRKLVLPSTYFTTTPFENWTHGSADLMGVVHLDVDWRVQPKAMRAELDRLLSGNELWDRRSSGLIVEDATGGMVRVRALMSAADSDSLFSLRAQVRESLVQWVAEQAQEALPARRQIVETDARP